MNRQQAKIYATLTPEQVKVLYPDFNIDCFEIMQKWANGYDVTVFGIAHRELNFNSIPCDYKFKPKTHIVNGIECPAPFDVMPQIRECFYIIEYNADVVDYTVNENNFWQLRLFEIGNCFKSEADARLNALAHWPKLKGILK